MRMTVSADEPVTRKGGSLGKRIAGIVMALAGIGLGLFIVLFGILPHPPFMATPLPFIALFMFALGAFGIWLLVASPARPRAVRGSNASTVPPTTVTLEADGLRPFPMMILQIIILAISLPAVLLIAFGYIGTVGNYVSPKTVSDGWSAVFIGVALLGALFLLITVRSNLGRRAFREAALLLPAAYQHWYGGGGLAFNPDTGAILVASGGLRRVYQAGDIRSAGFKSMNTSTISGMLESGITLEVRDIDHPRWLVPFKRSHDMERWHEILRRVMED